MAMNIIDISNQARSARRARPMDAVKGVVVHHTAGDSVESAMQALNNRRLGAQYIIDRDGTIYKSFPDGLAAVHMREAGSKYRTDAGKLSAEFGNRNLIGIEVVGRDDGDIRPAQVEATKLLTQQLSTQYGFPLTNVWGHGELQSNKQSTEGATIVAAIRGEPPPPPGEGRYAHDPFGVAASKQPQDAQSAISSLIAPAGGPAIPDMPTAAMGYAPNLSGAQPPAPPMPQIASTPAPLPTPPPQWVNGNFAQDTMAGGTSPPMPRLRDQSVLDQQRADMLDEMLFGAGPHRGEYARGRPEGRFMGGGAPDASAVPMPTLSPLNPAVGGPADRRPQPPMPTLRPNGRWVSGAGGAPDAGSVPTPPDNPRRDPYGFPIDVNRPRLNNGDGTFSTEQTITFDASEVGLPSEIVTIPTIINGQKVSDQTAMAAFARGLNEPVQRGFDSYEEADRAAIARTNSIARARSTTWESRFPQIYGEQPSPPAGVGEAGQDSNLRPLGGLATTAFPRLALPTELPADGWLDRHARQPFNSTLAFPDVYGEQPQRVYADALDRFDMEAPAAMPEPAPAPRTPPRATRETWNSMGLGSRGNAETQMSLDRDWSQPLTSAPPTPPNPYDDWTREFDTPGPITMANERMGVFEGTPDPSTIAPPPNTPEVGNVNYPGPLPTQRLPQTQAAVSEPGMGLGPYGMSPPPPETGPFFDNANPGPTFTPPAPAGTSFDIPPSPFEGSTGEFFTPAPPMPMPQPSMMADRFSDAFSPGGGGQIMDLQSAFDRRNAPPTMNAQGGINSVFGAPPAQATVPNLAIPFAEVPRPNFDFAGPAPAAAANLTSPLPMPTISQQDFDARFAGGTVAPTAPTPGVTPGVVSGTMPEPGAMDSPPPPMAVAPAPLPAPAPAPTQAAAAPKGGGAGGFIGRALGGLLGGPLGAMGGGLLGGGGGFGFGGSAAFTPIMGSGGTAPSTGSNGQTFNTTYRHGNSGNMQGTMWNRSTGGSVGYVTDPFTGAMIYSSSPMTF